MTDLWQETWDKYATWAAARSPEFSEDEYYRSGRPSKAWPEKEGPDWWAENGPRFVDLWCMWRDNCGLTIAELPDKDGAAVPGIELECWAYSDDDRNLIVKSIIDRVMYDESGQLYLVDLKTGSHTAPWPLQLALNNLCLDYSYGVRAHWAGFWSARKGGVEQWFDLSIYTDEWLWDMAWKAREIRNQQLFLPNPNNLCKSACGVRAHCVAVGGTPFFGESATMTQDTDTEGN